MSIFTEYTCDRCGHKQQTPEQMWTVLIMIKSGAGQRSYSVIGSEKHVADWCRKCMERFDLLPQDELPATEIKEHVTIEDLIREIVRDEKQS